jgi:hypothetical protein
LAQPDDPRIRAVAEREGVIGDLKSHSNFDLIEISSLHFLRWYRAGHPRFMPIYSRVRSGEDEVTFVKRFEADFINRDLYMRLDPMFGGYFISPTLEFYAPLHRTLATHGVSVAHAER